MNERVVASHDVNGCVAEVAHSHACAIGEDARCGFCGGGERLTCNVSVETFRPGCPENFVKVPMCEACADGAKFVVVIDQGLRRIALERVAPEATVSVSPKDGSVMRLKAKRFYECFLVVVGSGDFPVDMLRYDACHPLEQVDAAKLEPHRHEPRVVVLCRRSPSDRGPEVDRWKSFGWKVLGVYDDSFDAREIAGIAAGGGEASP